MIDTGAEIARIHISSTSIHRLSQERDSNVSRCVCIQTEFREELEETERERDEGEQGGGVTQPKRERRRRGKAATN